MPTGLTSRQRRPGPGPAWPGLQSGGTGKQGAQQGCSEQGCTPSPPASPALSSLQTLRASWHPQLKTAAAASNSLLGARVQHCSPPVMWFAGTATVAVVAVAVLTGIYVYESC